MFRIQILLKAIYGEAFCKKFESRQLFLVKFSESYIIYQREPFHKLAIISVYYLPFQTWETKTRKVFESAINKLQRLKSATS